MISMDRCVSIFAATAAVAVTAAIAGCATQSDTFRRMSAEDHERAASGAVGAGGAALDDHLAAARELRAEEQSACAAIPDADREQGPLARRDLVVRVEPLSVRPFPKEMLQPAGAAVYLRATPGMTAEWMGRILECHLAHHAVVGDRMVDRESPLFVDDARVAFSSTGDGFRIAITAREVSAARVILEKAQALVE